MSLTQTLGKRVSAAAVLALCAVSLSACGGGDKKADGGRGPGGPGGRPVEVGFVVVQPGQAPLNAVLSGRTVAYQSSEVRPQVTGVIKKRLFTEGALVRQGQPLYEIDPSLYQAAVGQAQANLQSAQASFAAARAQADRFKPLAEIEAVSKQEYTNAEAAARQAEASVAQNRAALETARINLRFATVPAPITGRVGRSLFTVGALVTASQADPLTTIQQLDPMFVDIQQSAAELLTLRRAIAAGGVAPASAQVRLTLEDGSQYSHTGVVEFSEVVVDPSTGAVTLRVRVPNPQGLLLPGMFLRASFAQGIDRNVFLVPQQAVGRTARGEASVWLVGEDGKAVQKTVTAERTQDTFWVVTQGLKAGDKVITQGLANLRPGAQIRPVPASKAQTIAPRQNGAKGGGPNGGQGGGQRQGG
ncbi:efflux RND transporter periplasmic adaptor subunit [Caulobacter segnis]|uniref:efflux RND transporter periplasmic adaptor subunit n=1 Tax=Caulobacter segnis TaxID=88688 RepID=UPI00240EDD97|nr:efflux RND transporter periplasmic adaptor subunit [Caulobacter segnis]MDG2520391.1 efflux RND transporter periplasmic adaptor subunit [Caulobacter segnis]